MATVAIIFTDIEGGVRRHVEADPGFPTVDENGQVDFTTMSPAQQSALVALNLVIQNNQELGIEGVDGTNA